MFSAAYTLCLLFSVWAACLCQTLVTVGPCVGDTKKATVDCSRRNLTSVPQQIWPNVTELDLSENHLSLLRPKSLKSLKSLDYLIKLNLSGNDLPLLAKRGFYYFPSLQILDLSRCKLAAVDPGALLSFPRLQKLVLGINDLQTPTSAVGQGHARVQVVNHSITLQFAGGVGGKEGEPDNDFNMDTPSLFLRKLLVDSVNTMNNTTDANNKKPSDSWKYLVAVLVLAVSLSILIAIGAKCKLLRRYLDSYRHSRLIEGDGASQCDPAGFDVGFSSPSGIPNSDGTHANLEDDDGFIEDNYIQASERERAAREAERWRDDDDEDIEEFSIG